jgi:hypothetical protein
MQKLIVGQSGTITTYPRVANGHDSNIICTHGATSVTALNKSPANADAQDSYARSVTLDTFSASVQGAQALGSDSITLSASHTIVEGRNYIVVDDRSGHRFVVTTSKGGTSNTMWLAEPLPHDIASNSTVIGFAVTCAIPSNQTTTAGNGVVYFRGTIDGAVREWAESYRIVYRVTSIALTPTMLTQDYPIIRQITSNTDFSLEEAIQASWRNIVVPVLAARGILDEDVLTDDVIVPFHEVATVLHFARNWPSAPQEWVKMFEENFERVKQTMFDRIDLLIASAQTETPTVPDINNSPARRQMRAVR